MPNNLKVYKASAGSGKTFTLAVEYIKLLVKRPEEYKFILAVTFTNKATAEMKNRILSKLYGIANHLEDSKDYLDKIKEDEEIEALHLTDDQIRINCAKALHLIAHDYSHFRIETIDSFFQSIIRELTKELDLTANLRVDLSAAEVLEEAVRSIIDDISHDKDLFHSILSFVEEKIEEGRNWQINSEVCDFGKNIFKEDYLRNQAEITASIESSKKLQEYSKRLQAIKEDALKQIKDLAERFAHIAADHDLNDKKIKYYNNLSDWINKSQTGEIIEVSTRLNSFLDDPQFWLKDKNCASVVEDILHPMLVDLYRKVQPDVAFKVNTVNSISNHINHLKLLNRINIKVRELNKEANRFLLADSAHFLHDIIDGSDIPFIYEKTGTWFNHIMIDEFQDTSALQWENFKPLITNSMANQQSCLIVGDVKQSIYRWRDSDWQILNKKIKEEFDKNYNPQDLDTNFRSAERIITFNDKFFFNAKKELNEDYHATYGSYSDDLNTAYSKVEEQKVAKKNLGTGYVHISNYVGKDNSEVTPRFVMEKVKELHEQGVDFNDMTILIRFKKDIPVLCQFFNDHYEEIGVRIVSDEAYRLDSSAAINLIILALTAISDPTNRFALCNLAAHYQMALHQDPSIKNDVNRFFAATDDELEALLPEGFMKNIETYSFTPLIELIEQLYSVLALHNIPNQDSYLFYFHDKITEFIADNQVDIDYFLQYWEDVLSAKTIPNGASDGIKIMSIHKSKGLEFHTVIIPYCNWTTVGKYNDLLWFETGQDKNDGLPIAPVNYNKSLDNSIFQSQYRNEVLKNSVDNLNLLYVAFTRAGQNLIVLTGSNTKPKLENISNVQHVILRSIPNDLFTKEEKGALTTWTWGEVSKSKVKDKIKDENEKDKIEDENVKEENILERKSKDISTRFIHKESSIEFRQSNESMKFILSDDEQPTADNPDYIEIGNLYHLVFSRIKTLDDVDSVIDEMNRLGYFESVLSVDEARTNIKAALTNPQTSRWFDSRWTEYNECEILTIIDGDAVEQRPDRVITDGNETIVIDYKSGKENKKYKGQVLKYMELLTMMGYKNVKGYLWYFMNDEIVEVRPYKKGGKR